ncbi:hypothetical protein SFBM_0509 [Candidatus Arthromitus sp. SFB-mouse-Japan]|uniref:hypothetical protein n=1 Tax=Candidatus Arthromitus sp. SFB-mouse TaxID=49118 RepID=UPI00021B7F11|nr:hypothetical protein [Candidatus Arthromitus sp. SFB-mouse]BAK56287.1 hypothetical protein SFBM_0509 [Candidatus Arthromitus sp. SFB-mouse-Japan]
MKSRHLILGTFIVTLTLFLTSCSNAPKTKRTIIGEIEPNSQITQDFSKFSGTESYKFTISKESTLKSSLKLRTGKTYITVVDEDGKEYLHISSSSKEEVTLKPNSEKIYYIDLKYDNGIGTYSFELNN